MQKISETAFAIWVAALLAIVVLVLTSKFIDWPCWKDAFWSGWAQTVGAIGAVYAAFRVGRNQVKAEALRKQGEAEEERLLALHLVYAGLFESSASMRSLSEDPVMEKHSGLREIALARIVESSQALKEPLRMRIPIALRAKIMEARAAMDQFISLQRLYVRPLAADDVAQFVKKAAVVKKIEEWVGSKVLEAEARPTAPGWR